MCPVMCLLIMGIFQCSSGSNYEPGERSSGGGGGGGGSRTSIKREKDTMTKEVLDHLLRDDVSIEIQKRKYRSV